LTIRAEKNTETGPPAKTPVRYPFKTRDIEKTRFLKTVFLAFPAEESVDFFTGEISGLNLPPRSRQRKNNFPS